MKNTCKLCNEEIKTTFLDKINGTIIKFSDGDKSEKIYVCSACQKEHKDKIREKVSNKD